MAERKASRVGVIVVAVLVAGAAVGSAWGADPPFATVAPQLAANAAAWVAEQPLPHAGLEARLAERRLNEAQAQELLQALPTAFRGPEDLYVAYHLIQPLTHAAPPVVQFAVTRLRSVYSRAIRFQSLRTYSKEQLKQFQYPDNLGGKTSPQDVLKMIEAVDQNRRKKKDDERSIVLHNEMAGKLEVQFLQLMLRSGDPSVARAVGSMIQDGAKANSATFVRATNAIAAAAPSLAKDFVPKLYDELKGLAESLRFLPQVTYVDQANITFSATDNSSFGKIEAYPGIQALTALNALAKLCAQPELPMPTASDIDAWAALNAAAAKLTHKDDKEQAKAAGELQSIITKHPGTVAAAKAQELLDTPEGKLSQARPIMTELSKQYEAFRKKQRDTVDTGLIQKVAPLLQDAARGRGATGSEANRLLHKLNTIVQAIQR